MAVSLERDNGVGIIKLNNPPANAYDHAVMKELDEAIYEIRFDPGIKAVVVASDLPRFVGMSRALDLMITGVTLSPQQALEIGLVNRVVAADQLMSETMGYAQKIASGPSFAAGMIKLAAVQGSELPMDGALLLERELLNRIFASEDAMEGMSAFLEKRQPSYKGE